MAKPQIDVGIIICNSKYRQKNGEEGILPGVENDFELMKAMLRKQKVLRATNAEDIRETLYKLLEQLRDDEGNESCIQNLHFHFSGHGGEEGSFKNAPNVLIGTNGELFSHNELKNHLWDKWQPEALTITLDCCRGKEMLERGLLGHPDVPKHKNHRTDVRYNYASDLKKLGRTGVLYSTVEGHRSSDGNSLTKELSAVTGRGTKSIPILNLCRAVNISWRERGVMKQASKEDFLQDGDFWSSFMWPRKMTNVAVMILNKKNGGDTDMMTMRRLLGHHDYNVLLLQKRPHPGEAGKPKHLKIDIETSFEL